MEDRLTAKSFDEVIDRLYSSSDGRDRLLRSMTDDRFAALLERIEAYVLLAKEQFLLGNKKHAYRMYLCINAILRKAGLTVSESAQGGTKNGTERKTSSQWHTDKIDGIKIPWSTK